VAGDARGGTISTTEVRPAWIQIAVAALSIWLLVWSALGWITEPSFASGSSATAKRVLGVDFNAWHAISGIFPIFLPGIVASLRESWSFRFAVYAALALCGSALLVLISARPLPVLYLPHNEADAVLHFSSGACYAAIAWLYVRGQRHRVEGPTHLLRKRHGVTR
jgi:hypothetical protein